jgi:hypothetical protein
MNIQPRLGELVSANPSIPQLRPVSQGLFLAAEMLVPVPADSNDAVRAYRGVWQTLPGVLRALVEAGFVSRQVGTSRVPEVLSRLAPLATCPAT